MALTMSIAVVEGLSGKQVADRLDADLTEETVNFYGVPARQPCQGQRDGPVWVRAGEEMLLRGDPYAAGQAVSTHSRGRAVLLDNPYDDAPALEDEGVLARLSRATTVALFQLNEHVNCGIYMASGWADGVMAWKITHCREEPETEELRVLGVPPEGFAAIAAPYRAKQAQADATADATGDYICYLGGAVVDLFTSVTGIKFYSPELGWWEKIPYRVLSPRNEAKGIGRS